MSSQNFKGKRTSSLETFFKSQNINEISAQNNINRVNLNKKSTAHDSKSSLHYNIKYTVSK